MDSAVVLLSGGVDSTTLLHDLKRREQIPALYALSIVYGQRHAREIACAEYQAAAAGAILHRVVDLSVFANVVTGGTALTSGPLAVPDYAQLSAEDLCQPPTYVPNRNMLLLALAAAYAEARGVQAVFYGAQTQDRYGYWDCTAEFVERLNAVLALNRKKAVTVHAPYCGMRKAAIIRIGVSLGVDYGHTWTCYRGGLTPCAACPACVERAAAFREAGLPDPLLQ